MNYEVLNSPATSKNRKVKSFEPMGNNTGITITLAFSVQYL